MNENLKKYALILIAFILLLTIAFISLFYKNMAQANNFLFNNNFKKSPSLLLQKIKDTTNKRCPADAKKCPDGSYVSRVAPSCSFALCPNEIEER